jgi:endoglucanase
MDDTEKMLKELTEATGVPGYEMEIRSLMRRYLEPLGRVIHDRMGSLICERVGDESGPRVALVGHMDEVGFMVKHITKEGFIRFTPLGGWWEQVLLAQRVVIKTHKGDVMGVLGAKPPHLLSEEERKKPVEKKDMYIDIGASSQEAVEAAGVRPGDPVVPLGEFSILSNPRTYLAKACDDRVGCDWVIAAMKRLAAAPHPNILYGVATVQEEVGTRGAATSVEMVNPDVAIILEVDIAGDVPGIKPEESTIKLGEGPAVLLYDSGMIPNIRLRDLVIDTARSSNIPLQVSVVEGGATDGRAIHLHKGGVPTVVMGIPTRHIHSHSAILHRDDFDRGVDLVTEVARRLDKETVARLTAW